MVIANFSVKDKVDRSRFFQETFLVADTKFEILIRIFFLEISNADILFGKRIFTLKFYITNKASITKQVQIIDPKFFFIAALNTDSETFIIYMTI